MTQAGGRTIFHCERMASTLSEMSGLCDISLGSAVRSIASRIEHELDQHTRGDVPQFTLPLSEVDASMAYSVGGKNANLGELRNMLDMPVPLGFSVLLTGLAAIFVAHAGAVQKPRIC